MILVVCALRAELPGFEPAENVEIVECGIGPVEAAAATARALAVRRYDAVVSAGIAGVFPQRGNVGEAYVVGEEIFSGLGWEDGGAPELPGAAQLVRRARASGALLRKMQGSPYRIVRGLTSSCVTTATATAIHLQKTYDVDVESMEGFAVLRCAELAAVPAIGVRGISNIVGDRTAGSWSFTAGSSALTAALRDILPLLPVL